MGTKGDRFEYARVVCRDAEVGGRVAAGVGGEECDVAPGVWGGGGGGLTEAGASPGGPRPMRVPDWRAGAASRRDLGAAVQREAYTGLARTVPLPDPGLYDALYDRHRRPEAWQAYPDAAEVLAGLRRAGIAVCVVSNIGWDPRPVFRAHGLDALVDAYALSFEHGLQKPDPGLFRVACALIGLDPADVVMVGDDRHADGGAAALGCEVRFVDHLPVAERPDGLRSLGLVPE